MGLRRPQDGDGHGRRQRGSSGRALSGTAGMRQGTVSTGTRSATGAMGFAAAIRVGREGAQAVAVGSSTRKVMLALVSIPIMVAIVMAVAATAPST